MNSHILRLFALIEALEKRIAELEKLLNDQEKRPYRRKHSQPD